MDGGADRHKVNLYTRGERPGPVGVSESGAPGLNVAKLHLHSGGLVPSIGQTSGSGGPRVYEGTGVRV